MVGPPLPLPHKRVNPYIAMMPPQGAWRTQQKASAPFLVQKSSLNQKWPLGANFGAKPVAPKVDLLH